MRFRVAAAGLVWLGSAAAAQITGTQASDDFTPPADHRFVLSAGDVADFRQFTLLLLEAKRPAEAYHRFAARDFVQHAQMFGATRESTISQWAKVTANPASHFEIEQIGFTGSFATVQFRGVMDPSRPGAEVTCIYEISGGKLRAEWSRLTMLTSKR